MPLYRFDVSIFGRLAAIACLAVLASPLAAAAQDLSLGKQAFSAKAGCPFCHGWAGDGKGDPRSEGGAPTLRTVTLTRDQIVETIKCGRPSTAMPHFDRFAYTDKRCYGMTAAEMGGQKPKRGDVTLQKDEIEAVADYLLAKVIGKGPVTPAECIEYFGSEINECKLIKETGGH